MTKRIQHEWFSVYVVYIGVEIYLLLNHIYIIMRGTYFKYRYAIIIVLERLARSPFLQITFYDFLRSTLLSTIYNTAKMFSKLQQAEAYQQTKTNLPNPPPFPSIYILYNSFLVMQSRKVCNCPIKLLAQFTSLPPQFIWPLLFSPLFFFVRVFALLSSYLYNHQKFSKKYQ